VIAGSGSLTIDGPAHALTAANGYSGKTILKDGVLSIGVKRLWASIRPRSVDQLTSTAAPSPVVNFSMTIAGSNHGVHRRWRASACRSGRNALLAADGGR
jgi:hypothetical protein